MVFLYEGKLNDSDIIIAQRIEENPHIIIDNNIFKAADILGISASKLTKYCQRIGLKGFKEIKYKIEQNIKIKNLSDASLKYEFNITQVIDPLYHQKLIEIPKFIKSCSKIIVVSTITNNSLAAYLTAKLRASLKKDVVAYIESQDFSFEYINHSVVTIIIDEDGHVSKLTTDWYRPKHCYIHITKHPLNPDADYFPLALSNQQNDLPFDVATILIFDWLSK